MTARHVIHDELEAERELEHKEDIFKNYPEHVQNALMEHFASEADNKVFDIIFTIPTLDDVLNGNDIGLFSMNINNGAPYSPCTLSDSDIDLAIISLDQHDKDFADNLEKSGYVPIEYTDISSEEILEGSDVFTVGYPAAMSIIGDLPLNNSESYWRSASYSLPVSSFGKVLMFNKNLYYFWSDISIYPGNSGGPIIFDDKLVGIVSAQAVIDIEDSFEALTTRIPFGKIIQAKFIDELFKFRNRKK